MPGIELWRGESELDGSPIVAIATWNSSNVKTGDMVQIWIMKADEEPHVADSRGVCGDCPMRGGECYVVLFQGPLSVYRCWQRGGYSAARELPNIPIRFGAYGDPTAVPFSVWEGLI